MEEKKVLIVDDDKVTRTIIGNILEKEGWTFVSVENGRDALEVVKGFKPDVVTLDYIMPDLTGIEVFKELKKSGLNVPVIFLTVSKEDDLIKQFLRLGAFGYLTKPFRPSEIIFILTKAFKYKILKENINNLENMKHDFNSLYDTITNLANQGIDAELGRRILVDRQKTFQLAQFFNLYNDRQHTISEKIGIIEKLSHNLSSDNAEYSQALKNLKNAVQDINRGFSTAEKGLKEVEERKTER